MNGGLSSGERRAPAADHRGPTTTPPRVKETKRQSGLTQTTVVSTPPKPILKSVDKARCQLVKTPELPKFNSSSIDTESLSWSFSSGPHSAAKHRPQCHDNHPSSSSSSRSGSRTTRRQLWPTREGREA